MIMKFYNNTKESFPDTVGSYHLHKQFYVGNRQRYWEPNLKLIASRDKRHYC